jgi:hypothetical protein
LGAGTIEAGDGNCQLQSEIAEWAAPIEANGIGVD